MKEKKRNIPFIIVLIVLSLVVFISGTVYKNYFKEPKIVTLSNLSSLSKQQRKERAIREYIAWIGNQKVTSSPIMPVGESLIKLGNAVRAIAAYTNYKFQFADLAAAESNALRVKKEKSLTKRSFYIRQATAILADAIVRIQRQKYPELKDQADRLKTRVNMFKGTDLEFDQNEKANRFLEMAADILQKMN